MSERRREDVDTLELLSRVTAAELRISILEAAANEPAPQETDEKTSGEFASGECLPVGAAPTKAQALEALDSLDDFARMADIDPIGPRKTLEAYINGAAPLPDVAEMVERLRNDHDRNYEDEAADLLEKQAARIAELEKALPTCDEHKPRGGARATCIICACEKLSGALSQISYLCGPPNELEVSEYDTHYDEQLVVEQVRKRIAELEAERDSYKAMVKEQWASAIPEGMVLVKLKNMMALRDALVEKDHDEAYHQLYYSVDWDELDYAIDEAMKK